MCTVIFRWVVGGGKQQELLIYGLLSVIQDDQETHLGLFLVSPLQV